MTAPKAIRRHGSFLASCGIALPLSFTLLHLLVHPLGSKKSPVFRAQTTLPPGIGVFLDRVLRQKGSLRNVCTCECICDSLCTPVHVDLPTQIYTPSTGLRTMKLSISFWVGSSELGLSEKGTAPPGIFSRYYRSLKTLEVSDNCSFLLVFPS